MNSTDDRIKLRSFFSYINSYLQAYRKKQNLLSGDTVILHFLEGTDTIRIYCNLSEPSNLKVGDFWYSGGTLRKCIFVTQEGVQQYTVCYAYSEAFSTTVISLNPNLTSGSGNSVPLPNPTNPGTGTGTENTGDNLKTGGGTMFGPLYLRQKISEPNEAVPKKYVDEYFATINNKVNRLSEVVSNSATESVRASQAVNTLRIELQEVLKIRVIRVTKTTATNEWAVVHNANSRSIIVQVYNESGEKVEPDAIQIINLNAIKIYFAYPMAGNATIFIS